MIVLLFGRDESGWQHRHHRLGSLRSARESNLRAILLLVAGLSSTLANVLEAYPLWRVLRDQWVQAGVGLLLPAGLPGAGGDCVSLSAREGG